jgi:hypothetical protein
MPRHVATHLPDCACCREIVAAAHWMQALARPSEAVELPDPKLVLWRAQISARHAAAEKTRSMLGWLETASGAVVLMGLAGWVAWHWFAIQAEGMKLLIGMTPRFALLAYSLATLAPALLLLAAMVLAYPLLVRD